MNAHMQEIGVYAIVQTETNKFYIGSTAKSFGVRCSQHLSSLRIGRHANRKLQNAWNKYGESRFVFEILEIVENKALVLEAEQRWIDTFRLMRCSLFNISPTAGSQVGHKHTAETRSALSRIQRQNKQRPEVAQRHSDGSRRAWQREDMRERVSQGHIDFNNSKERRERAGGRYAQVFAFTSPDGIQHNDILNLSAFCRQHELDISAMAKVHKGKLKSHKGWGALSGIEYREKELAFVAPDGTAHRNVRNLALFCQERGLPVSEMWLLGHNRIADCQGWKHLSKERG